MLLGGVKWSLASRSKHLLKGRRQRMQGMLRREMCSVNWMGRILIRGNHRTKLLLLQDKKRKRAMKSRLRANTLVGLRRQERSGQMSLWNSPRRRLVVPTRVPVLMYIPNWSRTRKSTMRNPRKKPIIQLRGQRGRSRQELLKSELARHLLRLVREASQRTLTLSQVF